MCIRDRNISRGLARNQEDYRKFLAKEDEQFSGYNDGRGTFGGNGSSFELGGRSLIAGPSIGERPKEEGKVVLNIWVNREGNILRVSHNLKESTTTSQYLFNLAKKSAQKAKFNPSPNSAPEQRGKMTFIFILQ